MNETFRLKASIATMFDIAGRATRTPAPHSTADPSRPEPARQDVGQPVHQLLPAVPVRAGRAVHALRADHLHLTAAHLHRQSHPLAGAAVWIHPSGQFDFLSGHQVAPLLIRLN